MFLLDERDGLPIRQIVEERRRGKVRIMNFEAYKYTPEEIRLRIKDLVEMQRSREEFSEETLAEFEAILK